MAAASDVLRSDTLSEVKFVQQQVTTHLWATCYGMAWREAAVACSCARVALTVTFPGCAEHTASSTPASDAMRMPTVPPGKSTHARIHSKVSTKELLCKPQDINCTACKTLRQLRGLPLTAAANASQRRTKQAWCTPTRQAWCRYQLLSRCCRTTHPACCCYPKQCCCTSAWCGTVPCYAVLCCAALGCAVPCCAAPLHAVMPPRCTHQNSTCKQRKAAQQHSCLEVHYAAPAAGWL